MRESRARGEPVAALREIGPSHPSPEASMGPPPTGQNGFSLRALVPPGQVATEPPQCSSSPGFHGDITLR